MDEAERIPAVREEADTYRALGIVRQEAGDIEDAAAYYQMSLDLYPTAEAYIALAETLAARRSFTDAIAECRKAIALSPNLGNAYNDLAVYLIEEGRCEEAMSWLEKAIAAPVYDCRHYPHYHRGRLLERRARFTEARDAYQHALDLEDTWEPARIALRRVLGFLN